MPGDEHVPLLAVGGRGRQDRHVPESEVLGRPRLGASLGSAPLVENANPQRQRPHLIEGVPRYRIGPADDPSASTSTGSPRRAGSIQTDGPDGGL